MAGIASGTAVAVRAAVVVVVIAVGVVLLAAEGRGGAVALPGRRLVLTEEPLRFLLLHCAEGCLGQCRLWSGCSGGLATAGNGGGVAERPLLADRSAPDTKAGVEARTEPHPRHGGAALSCCQGRDRC